MKPSGEWTLGEIVATGPLAWLPAGWISVLHHALMPVLVSGVLFFSLSVAGISGFSPASVHVPVRTTSLLDNPFCGYAPDARGDTYGLPFSLVYVGTTWRELEPDAGRYDFEGLERENHLKEWSAQGKKVILRIMMDRPGELPHTDLPEWLYMAIGGAGTHYEGSLGKGFSPDYTQPVLMEAHRRLLHALGERYDDDPRIAFIELGSLGHWGEWHVMQEEAVHIPFPGQKVTDVYVRHYLEAFPGKMLLMRRPFAIAAKNDFGLYNDMFGDEEATLGQYLPWIEDGYVSDLNGESLPGMPAFWDKSPSGGELANGSGGSAWLRTELLERTIEQARLTHLSWLGPNVPDLSDPTVRRHAELLQMAMGYRFSVVSETHFAMERPTRMIVGSVMMENAGAAPFYFPWTAQLALMDVTGERVATVRLIRDIRILKPGRTRVRYAMACPATMAPGTYRLAIAIVDPDTGEPGIQMPMAEKTRDGWYLLGAVNVLP